MHDTFSNIKKLSEKCHLHSPVFHALKKCHENRLIEVRRVGSALKVNGEPLSTLSICKDIGVS